MAREWLVTNGLGGYASGTVGGPATRRYHGLLVAALAAPLGRRTLFVHVGERLRLPDGRLVDLSSDSQEVDGALPSAGNDHLVEFRLELGLPVWRYEIHGFVLERRILLPHEQNTVQILYQLLEGSEPLRIKLRVAVHHRSHDDPVSTPLPGRFRLTEVDGRYELAVEELPPLRLRTYGGRHAFTVERARLPEILYSVEESRGYEHRGSSWTPGYFRIDVAPEESAALVASTEPWETVSALPPREAVVAEHKRRTRRLLAAHPSARGGLAGELVLAADQFIVKPVSRSREVARLQAEGDEIRSVIAGYHWFTDWGRDTMIALEGLTLTTGRFAEASNILRTFAHSIRHGLLPNLFPEGEKEGLYHTADATLWFFHAIHRYLQATDDRVTLAILLPRLVEIAERHLRGTRFGIGVDPTDGLLRQGEEGYQLTWMDAKVNDWVVTPRRGKAVEINALWYNALCLLAGWLREAGRDGEADDCSEHAQRARASFNRRFWYDDGGYLYDVVDGDNGDDAACRPNQIIAISLDHAVLDPLRWRSVLDVVRERLVTPVGLRTLSSEHVDYRSRYYGDIRARDAAYHQGTVWPWLIGPFIDAWLKLNPDDLATARGYLAGFEPHLDQGCVGSVSEVFDAEPPHTPRGCIAQAWSVAEVLRSWIKTQDASAPR